MAYKTFQNGFPLPASDLNNFLMNQSVIVFSNASARSSTLPTPTEGMVTYLESDNQLYVFDGSNWVNVNDNGAAIPKSTVTTTGDLIVGNGNASVTRLGVGASQGLLYVNGSTPGWLPKGTDGQTLSVTAGNLAWTTPAGGMTTQLFTSSGTWTVPGGVNYVDVYLVGGGRGGNSGDTRVGSSTSLGNVNPGQASSMAAFYRLKVTAGEVWTVTVGAGGAGGAARSGTSSLTGLNGSSGTSSSFSLAGRLTLEMVGATDTFGTSPVPTVNYDLRVQGMDRNSGTFSADTNNQRLIGKFFVPALGGNGAAGQAGTTLAAGTTTTEPGILGTGGRGGGTSSNTAASQGVLGNTGGGSGGGAAASATAITTTAGNGGNAAANSGAGGGGGGAAQAATGATVTSGAGGNGGSGFVALVY